MRRVAAKAAGSCLASHIALGAVKPGMARLPARGEEIGHAARQFLAFGEGAAVVPQDRRAQRFAVGVEEGRAVHLAG